MSDTPLQLLALDTSTLTASVAVVRATTEGAVEVLAEGDASPDAGGNASERLMPLVAELMERAGLRMADLDAVAVGAGPGSFTGLRIGLATAKGLAFAAEKPLWLVSSLGALAWSMEAPDDALRVPVLDARRGELYAGFFRISGGVPRALAVERVLRPGDLSAAITEVAPDAASVAIAGDALVAHAAALEILPVNVRRVSGRATPSAVGVAALAAAGDRADGLAHGAPAYIRPAEAEVMYPNGVPGALRTR
ncbi:MAG TPA: tRNA (adenosine(37)-N6)-threonylcarbamoyltransferase complex dimerization subunit type 1 TsaB [Kofleriaceae bacterium]|nr:tRNA (adenosine(37)-N6)-threonylcarbamoyltransferase complex dimerization subunit type 1 TsaB [Kofleriaceae bacterium]